MRNNRRPGLLLTRLKFRSEMFPFHVKILVAPRYVDAPRIKVSAVLTDLRDMQREPAAHCFGDTLLDLRLRVARPAPVTLNHFATMFDLDERPARVVARPPKRREFLSRFQQPNGCGEQVRYLESELVRAGLEHTDR